MNLPELAGVQTFQQRLDGSPDQGVQLSCGHGGVLLAGLKKQHFINGDQSQMAADTGLDPAQRIRLWRELRADLLQHGLQILRQ